MNTAARVLVLAVGALIFALLADSYQRLWIRDCVHSGGTRAACAAQFWE